MKLKTLSHEEYYFACCLDEVRDVAVELEE